MKEPNLLKVREFKDRDYDMICRWCSDRRRQPAWHRAVAPPREILPPIGVIVYRTDGFEAENLAVLFVYLAQGSPTCFVEHCATKPGLSVKIAKEAIFTAVDYLKKLTSSMGYQVMATHVPPGMARCLEHEGWYAGDGNLIAVWATLPTALQEVA